MNKDKTTLVERFIKKTFEEKVKNYVRKFLGIYRKDNYDKICDNIIKTRKKVLNVGSGNIRLGSNVTNLDIRKYPNTDVVSDVCEKIELSDNSYDAIILSHVLEHLRDPKRAVEEMYRVLKKGGVIVLATPFIFKYHPCPYDYQRFTLDGLDYLFEKFEKIESGIELGATTTLRYFIANYIALFTFSQNKWINNSVKVLVFFITWPIAYLDILLNKNRNAKELACSYYYYAKKKEK